MSCESTAWKSRRMASRTCKSVPPSAIAHKVFARQYAEHPVSEDNGKVLLPARKDVLHRLCQRLIGLESAEISEHHALHGNAAKRSAHLDHPGLATCSYPHEQGDEEKERVEKQAEEAKNKSDRWPTCAAACVASV